MIDEPKRVIELRASTLAVLREMHARTIDEVRAMLASGEMKPGRLVDVKLAATRELIAAIDAEQRQRHERYAVIGLLRQACEQALAWMHGARMVHGARVVHGARMPLLKNEPYGDVVQTLCAALRLAGGDEQLLDEIERTAFESGFETATRGGDGAQAPEGSQE